MPEGPFNKIRHYRPMLQQAEQKAKKLDDANTKHLDNLKKALDESSTLNRNLGLSFVLFIIYVMIMVFNTSDLMLLLDETPIRLPLIGIEVPLIPFYVITPILVFALHINMLINISEHTKKLFKWKEIIKEDNRAELTLHPFLLNTLYLDTDTNAFNKLIVGILVDGVAYLLPLVTLVMIQVRFSDYQSWSMTVFHFVLTTVDFIIIFFYLYRNTNQEYFVNTGRGKKLIHNIITLSLALGWCLLFKDNFINIAALLISLGIAFLIYKFKINSFFGQNYTKGALLVSVLLYACINFELVRQILLKEPNHNRIAYYYARSPWIHFPNIEVTNQTLVKKAPSEHVLEDIRKNPKQEDSLWTMHSEGYKFSGRSLQYANLSNCKMYNLMACRANLSRSYLRDSNLSQANLYNANLSAANLSYANLSYANLYNANLSAANLSYANLFDAGLLGASLFDANLSDANLSDANLPGANLLRAKLKNDYFY